MLGSERVYDLPISHKTPITDAPPVTSPARHRSLATERQYPPASSHEEASASTISQAATHASDCADTWAEVGVDEDGAVSFHGPTSRFHVSYEESRPNHTKAIQQRPKEEQLNELASVARLQRRVWQPLLDAKGQSVDDFPPAVTTKLLKIYWTWQHPLHNCVYKPYFIRDMALSGPYFSEFLLTSIYALAGRHSTLDDGEMALVEKGERFMEKAKQLLIHEISQPRPKIATIQALLILAERQCSVGKISEGWLYTGMAIRMMRDVGLHLSPSRLNDFDRLDAGDLELRKRLYLSAYIWDKTVSISLGRPPSLTTIPPGADDILDFAEDSDIWKPVMIPSLEHEYPKVAAFTSSTFKEFCSLGEIITRICTLMYSNSTSAISLEIPTTLESELRSWYASIPQHLKMIELEKLTFCPPPHVFSLNLLYHTLFLLIYRPYFNHPRGRQVCIEASSIIYEYLLLYRQTFQFKIMTYLVTYCIYTTATINAMEIKTMDDGDPTAVATRLSLSLEALEKEVRQTPGVHRSVDIIKDQLRSPQLTGRTSNMSQTDRLNGAQSRDGNLERSDANRQDMEVLPSNQGQRAMPTSAANIDPNLPADPTDMTELDWGYWDMAGGFQPDVYHWTVDDSFLQPQVPYM